MDVPKEFIDENLSKYPEESEFRLRKFYHALTIIKVKTQGTNPNAGLNVLCSKVNQLLEITRINPKSNLLRPFGDYLRSEITYPKDLEMGILRYRKDLVQKVN